VLSRMLSAPRPSTEVPRIGEVLSVSSAAEAKRLRGRRCRLSEAGVDRRLAVWPRAERRSTRADTG